MEARTINLHTALEENTLTWLLMFSSFSRLKRIAAYWLRFIHNCKHPGEKHIGYLTTGELAQAEVRLVILVQQIEFQKELDLLRKEEVPSRLRKLNPFIDEEGVLRVGGRLKHAKIAFSQKHPMLLPSSHHLTALIIDYYHETYLHPGSLHLHCLIQSKFWIINARDVVRRRILHCIKCFRANPKPKEQFMGNLPPSRLKKMNAFSISGVDYGRPFALKMAKIRNSKVLNGYICLFVCFATKAIHLELVSDLSSDCFLAALKRFIARRGAVTEIHSDNGTNFVGAQRRMATWRKVTSSTDFNDRAERYLGERGVAWKFIPPGSPHMGGLWEAGVKSVKRHLGVSLGGQVLTYEELYTVLVQIESVLLKAYYSS